MENLNIISPDISGRKTIRRSDLKPGDVVVFATVDNYFKRGGLRTGFMVLDKDRNDWFLLAVNLYKEEGREWVEDPVPTDDILFFETTYEEKLLMSKYVKNAV